MSNIHFASEFIRRLTGLSVCQSSFSFYSNGNHGYDTSFHEESGFFIPRELKGYIRLDRSKNEEMRRTAHEVSHGTYLESMPTGQLIVSCDRQIAEDECHLFGRLLKKDERLLVLTDRGIVCTYSSDELNQEAARLVPDDIDLSQYDTVAFLTGEDFADYRNLRDGYARMVSSDIENQEGFCTLLEEKSAMEFDPVFAEQIFWANISRDDVYGRGFRKLKAIEARYGLSGVVDYLIKGGE